MEVSAEQIYNKGVQKHREGDLELAEFFYKKATDADERFSQAYINLGGIYFSRGFTYKAIKSWNEALALEPESIDVLINLGAAYAQVQQFGEAESVLKQAMELDLKRTEPAYNLVNVYLQSGNVSKALELLHTLMQEQPPSAVAFLTTAQVQASLGDVSAATETLQQLLKKIPDQAEGLLNLGGLMYERGKIPEAQDLYHRAVSLHPGHFAALATYGKFLCEQGDMGNGLMYLEKASGLQPEDWSIELYKGNAFQDLGQFEKAIASYRKAVALNLGEIGARKNLSRALSRFVPPWHLKMLADHPRNEAFERAIAKAVGPEAVVLDIGTGSGLLSLMAARCGAKKVIACEQSPYLAHTAREIIAKNGAAATIEVHQKKSTRLTADSFMEKPNVLVAEIFDAGLIGEGAIPSFRHALSNLCQENCVVIPARAQLVGRLVSVPGLAAVNPIKNVQGFDLSPFDQYRIPGEYIAEGLDQHRHTYLSEEFHLFSVDFRSLNPPVPEGHEVSHVVELEISNPGNWHGVAFWFHLWLNEEDRVSSAPGRPDNHWKQALYFFEEPREVKAGEKVRLKVCRNDVYVWFEEVSIDA